LEFCLALFVSPLVLTAAIVEAAAPPGPAEVAGRYLDAMESSDLDAAGKLFSATSSVFESGGREGAWAAYREHHLGPENGEIRSFKISRGESETGASIDGSMAFVAWPIEYRIDLKDGKVVESRGTVTFLLVKEKSEYRIRHLHWSSRHKPTPSSK
jgi:hypothetical protein